MNWTTPEPGYSFARYEDHLATVTQVAPDCWRWEVLFGPSHLDIDRDGWWGTETTEGGARAKAQTRLRAP